MSNADPSENDLFGIAIVGMAGRFPDAKNINEFWNNLKNGLEAIRPFTKEELEEAGVDEKTLNDPAFVNAGSVLPDAENFDAAFFGINKREAEIMDPQHRVFLETAWEALEDAGYRPEDFPGSIGVFGGVGPNTYFQKNVLTRPDLMQTLGNYSIMLGNEKEYAVTRVSFKLNLKGPSLGIGTACSTSAVAIHMASQSLLSGECDMALAGGAKITPPFKTGYIYEEGGIQSPDGECRAFDAGARGTVVGDGVGIIVLKRLTDAIQDGDTIHAVIKGSAINNDGSQKVGFTAPSIQGQAAVIEEALTIAGVSPDSIGYVETHGTGTSLGDPIEIEALTQAFRTGTDRKGYCPIGSVKTNIGHLDAAAGVAGVIKAVLILESGLIPASLNYQRPNPAIDFANSPFFVNAELRKWEPQAEPRRAGVSSFGLGGTNAHIILEEAPTPKTFDKANRSEQLLVISAKSESALDQATKNLADYLKQNSSASLADVAYTLKIGRQVFGHRRIIVGQSIDEAISALETLDPKRSASSVQEASERDVVFMFSGQGAQYVNMGLGLYQKESLFRQIVDQCADILSAKLPLDLRKVLYPTEISSDEAGQLLEQTSYTQPVLFTIEYALAKLWVSWGIQPRAMLGHSIGEYVAACLAGVFSLEDALSLVAARGRLMQQMPGGVMLAIPAEEKTLQPHLDGKASIAVMDSPSLSIVSGEYEAIAELEKQFATAGLESQRLHTSHAFHSKMMEPILESFIQEFDKIKLNSPQLPFVSNTTGTWITTEEAASPSYWAKQLRQPVHLRECFETILRQSPEAILLEVGPGRTLSASARRNLGQGSKSAIISSTRHPKEEESDTAFILAALGRLWLNSAKLDWKTFYANEKRQRISLPTYPFERKRYWITPGKLSPSGFIAPKETSLTNADNEAEEKSVTRRPDAPKTNTEIALAEIWQGLLGVDEVSIHDNFFDLGGSSLLATRLLTQVASRFGKKLPLSAIFEAPTLGKFTSFLDQPIQQAPQKRIKRRSSLIKIQDGQTRPPFFCVPGNLGNVFVDFEYLYRHLGKDQPFYGLQDGLGNPSKVKTLAARYVEDIRRVQPEGPYHLGGVCLGGVIAFEMAQQLTEQGQSVGYLALVEPATLSLPGANSYRDLFNDIWIRFTRPRSSSSGNAIQLSLNELITFVRLRIKLIVNIWSLKQYSPRPFPGHLNVFLTRESSNEKSFQSWRNFSSNKVEIQEIPGTHRSITGDNQRIEEDQMRVLGEKIRRGIDEALSKQNTRSAGEKEIIGK